MLKTIQETTRFISNKTNFNPEIGIILGTGLGGLVSEIDIKYSGYLERQKAQIEQIKKQQLQGKFGGATGTWAAHYTAYPKMDWLNFSKNFIRSLGLDPNLVTTQIEPHDSVVESYHSMIRVNNILIDLCRDIWSYVSRGILKQKRVPGEVGSSTMPHKINPIQFENAEGNLGLANSILGHLSN